MIKNEKNVFSTLVLFVQEGENWGLVYNSEEIL